MDIATIIGLVLGIGAVIAGQVLDGGKINSIIQVTAAIIVFGGTFGAILISFTLQEVIESLKGVQTVLKEPPQDPYLVIDQITDYAYKARKNGLLSLEKEIKSIKDPFLAKGLTMAVDGVDPNIIREAMETELEYLDEYGKTNSKIFKAAGGYSPTIGILGAVLGLIHVMQNISDPTKLGDGIAVAFVATVYGVGSANLLFLPIATKLGSRHRREMILKEMALEGIFSLAIGENPRLIQDKLTAFIYLLRKNKQWPIGKGRLAKAIRLNMGRFRSETNSPEDAMPS